MAQRGIREYHAKKMLAENLEKYSDGKFKYPAKLALVTPETNLDKLREKNDWIGKERLVVKPDQLFGKRGKHGLLLLNATFDDAKRFIEERMGKEVTIGKVKGELTHFLVEPFVPHDAEYYVAIKSERDGDRVYFSLRGGVDIEENWENVVTINIPILESIDDFDIASKLPEMEEDKKRMMTEFIKALFKFYADFGYAYLEINPFAVSNGNIIPLDLVAKLDDTASFECASKWGDIEFPPPFGRRFTKEEEFIKELDEKTGASLKLTILNPKGRVWTMVAGGGASVIYADTITDLGYGNELANYGEYSGNPSTEMTYLYAKTILDLMTREKDPQGREKIFIIGGGIANFTDVAKTFTGIVMALKEYKEKLKEANVKIYVRRGGPNYKEGLRIMRELGGSLGIPIEVYGPETHMTRIVSLALGKGA